MHAATVTLPDLVSDAPAERLRVTVRGAVQGVGFRPFIYRLAADMGLAGWVNNSSQGVLIEVEGAPELLRQFLLRIEAEKPPRSFIQSLEAALLDPVGYTSFTIRHSDPSGPKTALVLPDIATCPDCLREIRDPADRRYGYPFTNCTNCGPRFSIIEALPYDRAGTTMRHFVMCPQCQAEYDDPLDRRFHAQPNACPRCGPHLELWDGAGYVLASHQSALAQAADAIRCGEIVAIKGLGGFHLVVDARDERAVRRLRQRKTREEKPFALMFPTLAAIEGECDVSTLEERLLRSPEAPIVLLRRSFHGDECFTNIAEAVAPRNPSLGIMLPATPLHHLLMAKLGFPIVATSGNHSDEPICTDACEALDRLGGIADLFLVHNRPIAHHVDDSIVRVMLDRELVLRRARGFAPLPIRTQGTEAPPVLAVGAHLKNTVAAGIGGQVFVSQHIGDLETPQAFGAFERVATDLPRLYEVAPAALACDLHPDYRSTRFAEQVAARLGVPLLRVQHHYAHVLACMAENELEGPLLGVAWDGTGYGPDGSVWGGEWLRVAERGFERVACLRTFRLPGGEAAIREPWRTALGLLYEIFGGALFTMDDLAPLRECSPQERAILKTMLERGLNAPRTSSAGRLFDAVGSLLGLRQRAGFEGQAAMELEWAQDGYITDDVYPFRLRAQALGLEVDWEPMVRAILADLHRQVAPGYIAAVFHNTLAELIVEVAGQVGQPRVVLSGGCFQNAALTERAVRRLQAAGFRPYWHQRIPPNDGGIALGQVVAATSLSFNHEDHSGEKGGLRGLPLSLSPLTL